MPNPMCPFHELTGWACPGCGTTRCVHHVFSGAFDAAFLQNPLMFATLAGIAIFDLYAAIVLALRLPRWRLDPVPAWLPGKLRAACAALLLVNWLWLLHSRV